MQKEATVTPARNYIALGGKDVGVLLGPQMLYYDSPEHGFGSVILYKPQNDLVPQAEGAMSEQDLMRCIGREFNAYHPLNFLAIVANNRLILNPENRGALAYHRAGSSDCGVHIHTPLAYNRGSFDDKPDGLKISKGGVVFAERGRVIVALPKENDLPEEFITPMGLERMTDELFNELLKQ